MSDTAELVIREEQTAVSILEGETPLARVTFARQVAAALAPVITEGHLYATIQNRKHVLYEGWTTLGQMLGVFPVTVWSRPLQNGYEARVEARTRTGQVVGAAEAECTRDETTWAKRDDYALRSMAQTRAGSKALRMCLGFIVTLAGFDATPAEEMPKGDAAPKWTPTPDGDAPNCETCNAMMVWKYGERDGRKWMAWMCKAYKKGQPGHPAIFSPVITFGSMQTV